MEGSSSALQKKGKSLLDFDEYDPYGGGINSPRSLRACKSEGVLPQDLIYKPMEAFVERALSPRLVKLRHDFFEAKRKDLLHSAKKAYSSIVAEEELKKESSSTSALVKATGIGIQQLQALNSDSLKLERQKLLRAQETEKAWLRNALNIELRQIQILAQNDQKLTQEENLGAEAQLAAARRMKELNDRRQKEEETKQMEREAQNKLEKAIAKKEFERQQEEIMRQKEQEAEKQAAIHRRNLAEMERKREAVIEKEQKKKEAWERQQQKIEEMRAEDLRRAEVLHQQKEEQGRALEEQRDAREVRVYQSLEKNQAIERLRREDLEEKMLRERMREEQLAQRKAFQQEEGAKHSYQLMLKRKNIQEDAARKLENRKRGLLERQEDIEARLMEHELKKERYLDFKRELDTLKLKNKEINVDRQRRRDSHHRELVADQVAKKDERITVLKQERQRLWDLRRRAQIEAQMAREDVKMQILKQRVSSKFNPDSIERQVSEKLSSDFFSPNILSTSRSLPTLRPLDASAASPAKP